MSELLAIEPVTSSEPVVGVWLGAVQDARSRTTRALQAMPDDALDWSDACSPHTIGTLLYHIAAIEADWLFVEVREQPFSSTIQALFPHEVRDAQGKLTIVKGETFNVFWQRLQTIRQLLLQTYQSMSLEEFRRPRRLPAYDVTPEWVLQHMCQHEAEHRGELIALLERFRAQKEMKG